MTYADKTITCRDCGRTFAFTAGEQEVYASRGFTNEPGRCPECRAANQSARTGAGSYGDSGGGYNRGERQMFAVTCASCGGEARVPFQPRGDKPVYCSDCFQQRCGQSRGSRSRN